MTQLFLHMRHGNEFVRDPDGAYYTYLEDARREAKGAALEIMSNRVRQGQPPNDSSFEITDKAGDVVSVYPFHEAIEEG